MRLLIHAGMSDHFSKRGYRGLLCSTAITGSWGEKHFPLILEEEFLRSDTMLNKHQRTLCVVWILYRTYFVWYLSTEPELTLLMLPLKDTTDVTLQIWIESQIINISHFKHGNREKQVVLNLIPASLNDGLDDGDIIKKFRFIMCPLFTHWGRDKMDAISQTTF